MYPRLILCSAVLALAGAAAAQQSKPADAAKSFSLDLAPTPDASATPVPAPTPTPIAAPVVEPGPATTADPHVVSPAIPATETVSAPASTVAPTMSDAPPPNSTAATAPPAVRAVFTLDTPIQDLIADPRAKAVLDKDLPGMSDDENLDKFKMLSLRSLQPQTGGQLTDALLAKVAADLDVLGGGTGAVTAPLRAGSAKRSKDDSR